RAARASTKIPACSKGRCPGRARTRRLRTRIPSKHERRSTRKTPAKRPPQRKHPSTENPTCTPHDAVTVPGIMAPFGTVRGRGSRHGLPASYRGRLDGNGLDDLRELALQSIPTVASGLTLEDDPDPRVVFRARKVDPDDDAVGPQDRQKGTLYLTE